MKNPKPFGDRLPLPHAGMTYQRAGDIVERLFGNLTHLSFVVEFGTKGRRVGKIAAYKSLRPFTGSVMQQRFSSLQ